MNTETLGDRTLSAWLTAPGITLIQARAPLFSRKLDARADSRLVGWSEAGGYLRLYELKRGLTFTQKLIDRYQSAAKSKAANDAIPALNASPANRTTPVNVSARVEQVEPASRQATSPSPSRRLIPATGGISVNRRSRCASVQEDSSLEGLPV